MLSKVEVRTSTGALLTLTFDDVTNGYIVKDIDGLDPVKKSISSSNIPNLPGSQYQGSHRENRNIVLSIGLVPDYETTFSVGDLRDDLYNFFMPESDLMVELRFYDSNGRVVNISGMVESCETSIFSKEPSVDISIVCFDPDFVSLDDTTMSWNTSNSTTDSGGLLTVPYEGKVRVGVKLVLHVNRTLTEFTIYNRGPDNLLRSMDFSGALASGDVLTINTVRGQKAVTLNRGGAESSFFYGLSAQSINWVELIPGGDNFLRFYATGAAIPFDLIYTARYGGL